MRGWRQHYWNMELGSKVCDDDPRSLWDSGGVRRWWCLAGVSWRFRNPEEKFLGVGTFVEGIRDWCVSEGPGELWTCWDWNCTQCCQREWLQLRTLAGKLANRKKEAPHHHHRRLPVLLCPSTALLTGSQPEQEKPGMQRLQAQHPRVCV